MKNKLINMFAILGFAIFLVGFADVLMHFFLFLLHWDPMSMFIPVGLIIFVVAMIVDSDQKEKEEMQKRIDQIMKEEGWLDEDDESGRTKS